MKRLGLVLCVFIMIFVFSPRAKAVSIVDTGQPANESPAWSLNQTQWLAAQFILTQDYTLTDIYGFMRSNPGLLTLAVYGNTLLSTSFYTYQAPDTTNQYFSGAVSVSQKNNSDWYGLSGLDLALLAGSYWVSFEVNAGDTYNGAMPAGAPNPLFRECWYGSSFGRIRWWPDNNLNIGVKIDSNPVIPEPSSMQMLVFLASGIGLLRLVVSPVKKH